MRQAFMLIAISVFFLGCGAKPCTPVVEVKEVKVPVYPDIPEVTCDFVGEGLEPVEKLVKCLSLHKSILDNLRNKNKL